MAAVEACLQTIRDDKLMARAPAIFEQIRDAALSVGGIEEVRGRGCLIGIRTRPEASQVVSALRKRHVLAGGSADTHVLRLMPPLTTSAVDIERFGAALQHAMQDLAAASA